jgi:predicted GNAT family acetyltransferase
MNERAYSFLQGVLGRDGAEAFNKAIQKESSLSSAVVPRAILSWLNLATKYDYEGGIPGVENTYLQFTKSEGPGYSGAISIGEDVYSFNNASMYHVAASVAVSLGLDNTKLDANVRDMTVGRLGKSIDTLVKARVALNELQKKILDPGFGYQFSHEHHDLGNGNMLTKINVHSPTGEHVGAATFNHKGNTLVPGSVVVEDEHQRRGIASAMYAHAQKQTGKTIAPSSNQTPEGSALWQGNAKTPQFGKVELPGQSNPPKKQQEQMAPQAPQFQQAQPRPPAKKGLKITKAQAENKCSMCSQPQFRAGAFTGCLCFSAMAKNVKVQKSETGYSLEFKSAEWDTDAIDALYAAMRGR